MRLDVVPRRSHNDEVWKPTSRGDSLATTLQALKKYQFFSAFLISCIQKSSSISAPLPVLISGQIYLSVAQPFAGFP